MLPAINFILLAEAIILWIAAAWLTFVATGKQATGRRPRWFASTVLPGLIGWFVVAFIAASVIFNFVSSNVPAEMLRLCVHNRFPILGTILPFALVACGLRFAPSLLGNLFVLRSGRQMTWITFASVLASGTILMASEVVQSNGAKRFDLSTISDDQSPLFVAMYAIVGLVFLLAVALPVPLACWYASYKSVKEPGTNRLQDGEFLLEMRAGLLLGLAAGLGIVVCVYVVGYKIQKSSVTSEPFQLLLQFLARLGPGYAVPINGTEKLGFATGQGPAFAAFVVAAIVYGIAYWFGAPTGSEGSERLSPLFYLMLLFVLGNLFLSATAFLLDYVDFPVTLFGIGLALLFAAISESDHVFRIVKKKELLQCNGDTRLIRLVDIAKNWKIPAVSIGGDAKRRTLVAVTAAGGGIQAAAWSARVLTGLKDRYGEVFRQSLRVISSVSGGSVGTMFYLRHLLTSLDAAAAAGASGLTATARGLTYPDLLRIYLPSILVARDWDRGSELEDTWISQLVGPSAKNRKAFEWRLKELQLQVSDSDGLPFPIFNATIAETGQRMLIAPALINEFVPEDAGKPSLDKTRSREFLELYQGFCAEHLPVTTAARLSATFPYVSPLTRPMPPDGLCMEKSIAFNRIAYHYADGGYVDNEGMVSLINALQSIIKENGPGNKIFDRILILRIQPFPIDGSRASVAKLDQGWFYASAGPIDALQNVRVASQAERNQISANLFLEAMHRPSIAAGNSIAQVLHAGEVQPIPSQGLEIKIVPLVFQPTDPEYLTPLSWMLTPFQKSVIANAWNNLEKEGKLTELDRWLAPQRTIAQ